MFLDNVYETKIKINKPTSLYCDNKSSSIHLAKNLVFNEKTKHIEIDCHFIREKINQSTISLRTKCQLVDMLTTAVGENEITTPVSSLE